MKTSRLDFSSGTTLTERLPKFLYRGGHRVQYAFQIIEKFLEFVRRNSAFGRRFDESLLFQDSEGIAHLVLREVQQFRKADDADGLVLHDRLEHRHVTLQELDLGLNLTGERAPAGHGFPPPTRRDMVRDSVVILKRFDALM